MSRQPWIACGLLVLMAAAGCSSEPKTAPPAPAPAATGAGGGNGLSDADRATFYHLSEGSMMFPVAWFNALERDVDPAAGGGVKRFRDNLERFGFIPDATGPTNPYGLPIGLSVDTFSGQQWVGFTCAACHVGELHYQGKRLRVDGAPNLAVFLDFVVELRSAMQKTLASRERSAQFVKNLIDARGTGGQGDAGPASTGNATAAAPGPRSSIARTLVDRFNDMVVDARMLKVAVGAFEMFDQIVASEETHAGFGRTDAFGLGRNLLFGSIPGNIVPSEAPVSFPHLWGMRYTAWLQWAANTDSVMERNIAQALGTGATWDLKTFKTTVPLENLHTLEQLAYKTQSPRWPEDLFGPVDSAKAARGRVLFENNCASCHERPIRTTPTGLKVYQLFALDEIKTDPRAALDLERPLKASVNGPDVSFAVAALAFVDNVKNAYYKERNVSPATQAEWEQRAIRSGAEWTPTFRQALSQADQYDDTRGRKVYAAKPLAGIWATAPYLHNGSVATLYDLLLPAGSRPKKFLVGLREYDPVRLGYQTDIAKAAPVPPEFVPFELDVTIAGNSNAGHEYGTAWPDTERFDLLEYLKILQ